MAHSCPTHFSPQPLPSFACHQLCESPQNVHKYAYAALQVLTISGRTIKKEAQASPEAAAEAEQAIDNFLKTVCVCSVGVGVGVDVQQECGHSQGILIRII